MISQDDNPHHDGEVIRATGASYRAARRTRRTQLGMTLVEVIVAAALALVGFLVALVLYQAARNLFKKGEQATDQQQAVRVAYDTMLKDLRLAGYNWNASGEDRPGEEQIEGAWDNVVTVRGDYDFEANAPGGLAHDPEDVINGSTNKATVGNDEIVTYFLGKDANGDGTPDDSTGVTFNADVNSATAVTSALYGTVAARDGTTEAIVIQPAVIAPTAPPYNLYKAVLNNTQSSYGTGGFVQYQLLAENIKSLTFTYYDSNGNAIAASGLQGSDAAANKDLRTTIKKIKVDVVGMTAIADNGYTDAADTNPATQHFRKFSLTTQITPRNLGFKGRADVDTSPPTTPTGLAACAGHCAAMLLTWNANPSAEGVTAYTVKYGTNPAILTSVATTSGNTYYLAGLTTGTTYYFAVRATDAGGNNSGYSASVNTVVNNTNTPSSPDPLAFTATGHGGAGYLDGHIDLAWTSVTTNTVSVPACDAAKPMIRDLGGYRLYRSPTSPFTPAAGNLVVSETGTPPNVLTTATTSYSDTGIVNCKPYYYHLKAVDTTSCGNLSAVWTNAFDGRASTTTLPAAPTGVIANRTGPTAAGVTWNLVNTDTASPVKSITIDTYNVYRTQINTGANPELATYTYAGTWTRPTPYTPPPLFTDSSAPAEVPGKKIYYKVSALDDCPNQSAQSTAGLMSCTFNGNIALSIFDATDGSASNPANMDPSPKTVTVTATGSDTFVSAHLTILKSGGTTDEDNTIVSTGTSWNFTWTPNQGAGTYAATATVTNAAGCSVSTAANWIVTISSCDTCATITPNDPDPKSGSPKYYMQENTINNSCNFDISMTQFKIHRRTDTCSTCANPFRLLKIQYITTGAFANETSNLVYTATSPGDAVSTTQTATVNFSPALNLPATSSTAKARYIFSTVLPAGPIWEGTSVSKQAILEGSICFTQTSNLCLPACVTAIKLETQP